MGKKRTIDSKIRSSQSFAKLNYRQRDLWQGIIEVADDQGRMPGLSAYVRSLVWPSDDITLADVEGDLLAIEQAGYIVRYTAGDMVYLQVAKWWKYQTMQWAGKSDYPAPPGWVDRLRYHGKENVITTVNWDSEGGYVDNLPREQPSEQPSQQCTPLSCRDVKGEVNDDDEVNDEGEDEVERATAAVVAKNVQPFGLLYDAFLEATKISQTMLNERKAADTIREWVTAKITPEEVKQAVEEMQQKELTIVGPWSVTNAINIVRSKGNGKKKVTDRNSDEARRRYNDWDKLKQ